MKLELRKVGEHYFFILPADLVAQSDWANGDIFQAAVDGDGVLKLVRTQTVHDRALEIADGVMEKYRETFEALAKL